MSDSTALVLSDSEALQLICGVNDTNIRVLEQLFGAPVDVRGNELTLRVGDAAAQDHFLTLMAELEGHSRSGTRIDRTLIHTLYNDIVDGNGTSLQEMHDRVIEIPAAGTKVFPRSVRQARLFSQLDINDLNFFVGPAGTGKTYIAVAHALREVLAKRKRRLVLTRPVVEAGESLGFLPGDLTQKISPYLRPLYDAIEALLPFDLIRRLEEQNLIEIAPLAYMRGRSLRDSYVILDESQNTTREQMKMFLTRLGENTQAVVTGDITQIDLPRRNVSGLVHVLDVLRGLPGIGITHLTKEDVVRSVLVQRIIQAYDEYRQD
ncbi:MAG: PhoH family protein [Alkalispirochaeta sp.]